MNRLAACLGLIVAYSALAGSVPAIFLARARATGEVEFYGLWFAGVAVFALLGGIGCACVYAKKEEPDGSHC